MKETTASTARSTSVSPVPMSKVGSQPSGRAKVQQFLAQRTPKPAPLSQAEKLGKVKAVLSRQQASKSVVQKPARRVNPLADLMGVKTAAPVSTTPVAVKRTNSTNETPMNKRARRQAESKAAMAVLTLPPESYLRREDWDSSSAKPLDIQLPGPGFDGNNTLVISATIPNGAHRCSFNLCSEDKAGNRNVLYHFNPRRTRGGQIIQNSKIDERWGIIESLPRFPIHFGQKFQLRITLTRNGFAIFIGEQFQTEYQHRVPLKEGDVITLNLPTQDDYGNRESVIVHSVWWGHAEVPTTEVLQREEQRFRRRDSFEDRRYDVYVGGITQAINRQDIEELFTDFTIEHVRLMPVKGFGFVSLANSEQVERAIQDLNGKIVKENTIRVSRARGALPGAR